MIVETIIAGLTVIFVSSLAFANAQIKRQRQWDKEDSQEEDDDAAGIRPYLNIAIGTKCPVCGRAAEKGNGLRQPKICDPKEKCEVSPAHLHVECTWCNAKWLMRPADYRKKEIVSDH
jgi:hypothetical protein